MKSRLLLAPSLVLAAALAGCTPAPDPWAKVPGGPPRVLVTIPALASFVDNVAGDKAAVVSLCTNQGPHGRDFNIQETGYFRKADAFFAVGLGLDDEHFADKLFETAGNPRLKYVKLGDGLPDKLLKGGEEHDRHAAEGKGDEHEHGHGGHDPHVWLGIPQAVALVDEIRARLAEVDPAHAADYEANAAHYKQTLHDLHKEGEKLLEGKKDRKLISFHDSLGYFADSFGLKIVDVIEKVPGSEASSQDSRELQKLVELCQMQQVRVIAVEPQYPTTGSAETVLRALKGRGLDVKFVEVDPLETSEGKAPDAGWYVEKMRGNLKRLADALP
jgi:ABC-type Zn uptake system ZnuABC Zn-binding protein ZnuA